MKDSYGCLIKCETIAFFDINDFSPCFLYLIKDLAHILPRNRFTSFI